jgi:hypothetical protein
MREKGFSVHSLLYDDLLQQKEEGVRAVFKVCGIPESLVPDALIAFTRDSQRNSPVSMEATSKIRPLEFTHMERECSSQILAEFGYPPIDKPFRLPGSLVF